MVYQLTNLTRAAQDFEPFRTNLFRLKSLELGYLQTTGQTAATSRISGEFLDSLGSEFRPRDVGEGPLALFAKIFPFSGSRERGIQEVRQLNSMVNGCSLNYPCISVYH